MGILIGAGLVIAIGYARGRSLGGTARRGSPRGLRSPRAISFAAGQAGFTVVLFVLFNIIQPVGWRVGLVRIETWRSASRSVSVWGCCSGRAGQPRLLRENLAAAYGRSADYVVATAREIIDEAAAGSSEAPGQNCSHGPPSARRRFRQYLAERSATSMSARRRSGARGRRRPRSACGAIARGARQDDRRRPQAHALRARTSTTRSTRCGRGTSRSATRSCTRRSYRRLTFRDTEGRARLLECVRAAMSGTAHDRPVGARLALGEPAPRRSLAARIASWNISRPSYYVG